MRWIVQISSLCRIIRSFASYRRLDKPVIAAVEGTVTGAGMSLMLASDIVRPLREIQSLLRDLLKWDYLRMVGLLISYRVGIGAARAMEIFMLLMKLFDTDYAEKLHLVNKVVEDDQLQDEALAWADRLSQGPTRAYGAIKKLVMQSFEENLNTHLGLEHNYFGATSRTFDFREARLKRLGLDVRPNSRDHKLCSLYLILHCEISLLDFKSKKGDMLCLKRLSRFFSID